MKSFKFPLARIHNYKKQLLNSEKSLLGQLQGEKLALEQRILALEAYRVSKTASLQGKILQVVELSAHKFLLENTKYQLDGFRQDEIKQDEKIEAQRLVVLEMSKEVSALTKLEEKQREEHQKLTQKEEQEQILEYISMQR